MTGPLSRAWGPVTLPAAWLYGRAVAGRNTWYAGGRHVTRVAVPVISVGNITAGGAGKTPVVAWIVDRLREAGHRPAIAMRGYGGRGARPSDEAMEYAERCPETPVLCDPDRVRAIRAHLGERDGTDCVILDDGFQHRRIHRDLDLVLVDATRRPRQDHLLPWGYLREPRTALARADAVVLTRAPKGDELEEEIRQDHGRDPLAWTNHVWRGLIVHEDAGHPCPHPVAWLEGRRVVTLFGVGHPSAAVEQVREAGATVTANVPVRDHVHYVPRLLERIADRLKDADVLVTTRKDWVKLRGLIDWSLWPTPVVVPDLAIEVVRGEAALVRKVRAAVGSPDTAA